MEVLELLAHWTAVYEAEDQAEADTEEMLTDLAYDDLMDGLAMV